MASPDKRSVTPNALPKLACSHTEFTRAVFRQTLPSDQTRARQVRFVGYFLGAVASIMLIGSALAYLAW